MVNPMLDAERFRDVMAAWPNGVTIVAIRVDERVVATTVSAFLSLSLHPPHVLLALGPNATIRPFLQPNARFGVSVLGLEHRRLATIYADPYPVGPDPFPVLGVPVIADALIGLTCTVTEVHAGADHAIVIASVQDAAAGTGLPLVRYRRGYHTLAE
jgi:flavin reductase (DIM6/NTAB) family NADH-FMN oxidoreductase RutF